MSVLQAKPLKPKFFRQTSLQEECKHKLHFYPNLFISLTYILASGSNEVKQEEESDSAIEKPKLNPIGEPGTSGVSKTCEKRKFKGKDKSKLLLTYT